MFKRLAVGVMLATLVVACGGGDDDEAARSSVATATTLADLGAVLIDAPPRPGFDALNDVFGPFDLDRYLEDFSDDDADRQILTSAGFTRGYARGWVDSASNPTAVAVFVFEFTAEPNARSAREQLDAQSRAEPGATTFTVPAVADAVGLSSSVTTDEGQQRTNAVSFVRGNRLFIVGAQHTDPRGRPDLAIETAKAQAAKAS